jgi:histidinol-phosphate aminotransferase
MAVPIRNDLVGLKPYQSFDQPIPVRLNTNENPYPLTQKIADEIGLRVGQAVRNANRYPADEATELRQTLTNYINQQLPRSFQLSVGNVLAANGSNEIMDEILRAFGGPGRRCLTFSPTYSMYPQYCRDSFTELVQVPRTISRLKPEDTTTPDFAAISQIAIDIDDAINQVQHHRPALVLVANPNNPTGELTPAADIERLLIGTQSVSVSGSEQNAQPVVVVDEAYIDFRNEGELSALELLEHYPNLLIVRTLSKAFSFAGARLGYAIGHADIIDALRIVRLPYNLSVITQVAAITALEHSQEMLQAVCEIRDQRNSLFEWLKQQEYCGKPLVVLPSSANFIQFGFNELHNGPHNGQDNRNYQELPQIVHSYLLQRGVQIRIVGLQGLVRVTIGTPEENQKFRQEFSNFLTSQLTEVGAK